MKKALSLLAAIILVFSVGAPVFAENGPGATAPCFHAHDEDCGYVEAVPCNHAHDEDCGYIAEVPEKPCTFVHVHDESCGPDGVNCSYDPASHKHDPACGYAASVAGTPCAHTEHDSACGYVAEVPCTHECDPDCASGTDGGVLSAGSNMMGTTLMSPVLPAASIIVLVFEPHDGITTGGPLGGATVVLYDETNKKVAEGVTDVSGGMYTFSNLTSGLNYTVVVPEGSYGGAYYNEARDTVMATSAGSSCPLYPQKGTPPATYTVSGTAKVVSSQLHRDVSVTIIGNGIDKTTMTDANDEFIFTGIPNGTYTLYSEAVEVGLSKQQTITVSGGNIIVNMNMGLGSGTIVGRVVNASVVRTNCEVLLLQDDIVIASTRTNERGAFMFLYLSAGTYTVLVPAQGGYSHLSHTVNLSDGEFYSNDMDFSLIARKFTPDVSLASPIFKSGPSADDNVYDPDQGTDLWLRYSDVSLEDVQWVSIDEQYLQTFAEGPDTLLIPGVGNFYRGSVIIQLYADYLATLPDGEHTIKVGFTTGTASYTFIVQRGARAAVPVVAANVTQRGHTSPQTGDNAPLALFTTLGLACTALLILRRKIIH
ncbi:hypothetical protein LJC49_01050 [Ruminococcaceae bacterium OttesenSCG-928-I18]|nr:hypothetical protein [Ruminococcaceae bacterium OttesenSCG-928-I18]